MQVYRIDRKRYLSKILNGIGAALSSGNRWNMLHTPMVYTAESRALAILEVAVHLDLNEDLPNDRYIVELMIPDDLIVMTIDDGSLPHNWDAKPPLSATQSIGTRFIQSRKYPVLQVPSSIVPKEYNYLINPMHSDVTKIKVISSEPFSFDDRLAIDKI